MTIAATSNEPFEASFDLGGRRDEIERAERAILEEVERQEYDRASLFAVRLSLEEALSNALKHGNRGDASKRIRLTCRIDRQAVAIEVEDEGEGFEFESVPDPTEAENVEIPSGRGLKLMRAFMTEVRIHAPGNRVSMTYERPGT